MNGAALGLVVVLGLVALAAFAAWGAARVRPAHPPRWRCRIGGWDVIGLALIPFAIDPLVTVLVYQVTGTTPTNTVFDRSLFVAVAIARTIEIIGLPLLAIWALRIAPHQLGLHGRRVGASVVFGVLQAILWGPPTAVVNALVRHWQVQVTPNPAQRILEGTYGPLDWALVLYCAVIAAALLEEFLFRGVLQCWLTRRIGAPAAILITAVLFGLIHGRSWPDPIPLAILGIGLGITYQQTRSLWAPIAMHATFNAVMLLVGALLL